ncbi:hypothetical protein HAX54_036435 [Datura stramonium]|uniref:Uncharacterized protein n=1 Tax=Datura stramonium TaxID=4076 RepID=A0ABS8SH38_DATST|nr:hypothetical protein [Datura stramonium]
MAEARSILEMHAKIRPAGETCCERSPEFVGVPYKGLADQRSQAFLNKRLSGGLWAQTFPNNPGQAANLAINPVLRLTRESNKNFHEQKTATQISLQTQMMGDMPQSIPRIPSAKSQA